MTKQLSFTETELQAIREEYCAGATNTQFTNFITYCSARNLYPGKQVYFQVRPSREYDPDTHTTVFVKKAYYVTSIDAFRLTAQRSGEYRGQGEPTWIYLDDSGAPTLESKVPLPIPGQTLPRMPWAARASVFRTNFVGPVVATARFEAYAVYNKDKQGSWSLSSMWARRGPEQLLKCAESLALRQAFPEELAGLYTEDELAKHEPDEEVPEQKSEVTAKAPEAQQAAVQAAEVPVVNHEAATEFVASVAVTAPEAPVTKGQGAEPEKVWAGPVMANIPPLAPAPEPAPTPDRKPTKEERDEFVKRARVYSKETLPKLGVNNASDILQEFMLAGTGHKSSSGLSKNQWEQKLGQLDLADAKGEKYLVELVKGKA